MAAFSTEEAVRLRFQVSDAVSVPSALVTASIDDAHLAILERLDPGVDTQTPPEGLVLGETLLAGARLLRSLASKQAVSHKTLMVGGQRIDVGNRFVSLMALSKTGEQEAWDTLEPFLEAPARSGGIGVTDSTPVLGQE